MGIERKLITVGNSLAVTIPKGWLDDIKRKHGHPIEKVVMEISDIIVIKPIEEAEY